MKKTAELLRKSERAKDLDPEILKDLKEIYGYKKFKTHFKRLHHKKRKVKKGVNHSYLDGVLGLASFIRETLPLATRAATHVLIAKSISKLLLKPE